MKNCDQQTVLALLKELPYSEPAAKAKDQCDKRQNITSGHLNQLFYSHFGARFGVNSFEGVSSVHANELVRIIKEL